jgi:replicative DNA helicase
METIKNLSQKNNDRSSIISLEKGKLPPQAIDLEEAVLGALMIDTQSIDECLMIIKDSDVFYKDSHKLIFEAIKSLKLANENVDLLTVSYKLKTTNNLERIGGDYYLVQLTQKVASSSHIEFHSRILLQQWVKRKMIKSASQVIENAYDADSDIFDLIDLQSKNLDQINEQILSGTTDLTMLEALKLIHKRIEVLSSKSEYELSGCYTGFKKVDLVTNGFQDGDLIVIAARPGMGKTSLVMKTLLENVKHGIPTGFISCEMSTQQLITRMVACNSHFHLNQLFRTGFEKTEYFNQFRNLKQEMEILPAYFDDVSIDIQDVSAKIRLWKRKLGIKIVIIDYLQLMSCKSLGKNLIREQEISTITRTLKRLAKELKIPIVLLSQLSRDVESRGSSKRPMLKDLRESGAIEQDADMVAFIYRASYYGLEDDEDMLAIGANAEFIIAKHRNGSLDRKGLFFDENKTKFMDPEDLIQQNIIDNEMINCIDELPKINPNDAFESNPENNDFNTF